jgi:hypothetical protein
MAEHDIGREIEFHVEKQASEYAAQGLPREEALRRARLRFGGTTQVGEDCRAVRRASSTSCGTTCGLR